MAEKVVTAGNQRRAHLPGAAGEARKGGTALRETRRVFGRNGSRALARVGLPRTGRTGRLLRSHAGDGVANIAAEIENLVGEAHGCRHGRGGGGMVVSRLEAFLAEAFGAEDRRRKRALSRRPPAPVGQLDALQRRPQGEAVWRAGAKAGWKLKHFLRGSSCHLVVASGADAGGEDGLERGREQGEIIGFIVRVEATTSAKCDVALYFSLSAFHAHRSASHLEARLPVTRWSYYVGIRHLLNTLDGSALRSDH